MVYLRFYYSKQKCIIVYIHPIVVENVVFFSITIVVKLPKNYRD